MPNSEPSWHVRCLMAARFQVDIVIGIELPLMRAWVLARTMVMRRSPAANTWAVDWCRDSLRDGWNRNLSI